MAVTVAAEETRRPRRPTALVITGILAVVIAVLAAGGVVLARYQPLVSGSVFRAPETGHLVPAVDPVDSRDTSAVPYVDGQTVTFGFSVRNSGRWGITVTGFGSFNDGMLDHAVLRLSDSTLSADEGPFTPFALGPGQERSILVTARFANCESYAENTSATMDGVRVTFRVLDVVRSREMSWPEKIEIMSPRNADCPRPRAA